MRRRTSFSLILAASLLVAGCATVPEGATEAQALACPPGTEGCDEVLPVGPGGTLEMDMGNFFFTVTDGAPVTGEVLVTVNNISDAFHNAEFLGAAEGSDIPEADAFEVGDGSVLLFPGVWTVICNVPGHRAAGMETTITVYASEEEAQAAIEAGETDVDRDAAMSG